MSGFDGYAECRCAVCHYTDCHVVVIILNFIVLYAWCHIFIIMSVYRMSKCLEQCFFVVLLSVIMLSILVL